MYLIVGSDNGVDLGALDEVGVKVEEPEVEVGAELEAIDVHVVVVVGPGGTGGKEGCAPRPLRSCKGNKAGKSEGGCCGIFKAVDVSSPGLSFVPTAMFLPSSPALRLSPQ